MNAMQVVSCNERPWLEEEKRWNGKQYTEGYFTNSQTADSKFAISLKTWKNKHTSRAH